MQFTCSRSRIFRIYAGIMLHLLWLKHYTHDYDGIIYLSLSVTVTVQLRSFRSHYFYCLSQTVLDLEDSLDLKTEKPVSKCFQIYSLKSHYQYYNFRPKRNTLKMFNARHFPISQCIEDDWETHHSFAIQNVFAPNIWENRLQWVYIIPSIITWHMSLGYKNEALCNQFIEFS